MSALRTYLPFELGMRASSLQIGRSVWLLQAVQNAVDLLKAKSLVAAPAPCKIPHPCNVRSIVYWLQSMVKDKIWRALVCAAHCASEGVSLCLPTGWLQLLGFEDGAEPRHRLVVLFLSSVHCYPSCQRSISGVTTRLTKRLPWAIDLYSLPDSNVQKLSRLRKKQPGFALHMSSAQANPSISASPSPCICERSDWSPYFLYSQTSARLL